MSDLRPSRYQFLLLRQLSRPSRPAAAAHVMGAGHYGPGDDPDTRDIIRWAQGDPLVRGPAFFSGSGSPGRRPAGDREDGNTRSLRDGSHCLTCRRLLAPSAGDGSSLACPDHGRLLAAAVRLFRRNETVTVLAAVGHQSRLVARTSDGKRYRIAARRLRPLIMDDW
jgi:hypothetical protein